MPGILPHVDFAVVEEPYFLKTIADFEPLFDQAGKAMLVAEYTNALIGMHESVSTGTMPLSPKLVGDCVGGMTGCTEPLAVFAVCSRPMTLALYGNSTWTSPYVLSAFVALREKGLPFEVRDVDLHRREHAAPAFADRSLTSRVPVLVDGDFSLSESSAIDEYLDDSYPPPAHARVLPADVRARARARQVMAWLRSDLMPIREERSAEYVFYAHDRLRPFAPLSEAGRRAAAKLLAAAERLVPAGGGPLFGAWCIADTDLAMMLQRLVKTGHDVPPRVRAYAEEQWRRPAVAEFCAHERPPFEPSVML